MLFFHWQILTVVWLLDVVTEIIKDQSFVVVVLLLFVHGKLGIYGYVGTAS